MYWHRSPWALWSSVPTSSSPSLQSSLREFPGCSSILARVSVSQLLRVITSWISAGEELSSVTVLDSRQPNSTVFTRPGPSEAQGRDLPVSLKFSGAGVSEQFALSCSSASIFKGSLSYSPDWFEASLSYKRTCFKPHPPVLGVSWSPTKWSSGTWSLTESSRVLHMCVRAFLSWLNAWMPHTFSAVCPWTLGFYHAYWHSGHLCRDLVVSSLLSSWGPWILM